MKSLHRWWCRLFHDDPMWPGATWECRICGEIYDNPAVSGPVKELPRPQNVRVVERPVLAVSGFPGI
jgi:hypothetical protein